MLGKARMFTQNRKIFFFFKKSKTSGRIGQSTQRLNFERNPLIYFDIVNATDGKKSIS